MTITLDYETKEYRLTCDLCNKEYKATDLDMRSTTTGTRMVCLCPNCENLRTWKVEKLDGKGNVSVEFYPDDYSIITNYNAIEIIKSIHSPRPNGHIHKSSRISKNNTNVLNCDNELIGMNFFVGANRVKVSTLDMIQLYKLKEKIKNESI